MDDQQHQALITEVELTALAETPARRAIRLAFRFAPALLLLVGLLLLVRSGLLGRLSLEGLRSERGALLAFVRLHPLASVAAYLGVYVGCVALSLPAALVLTLTGGFLFGPWIGGVSAAVGCTLGATVVFLVSRLTVRDAVEIRAGPKVRALAEGIRKDAFFYILTLRLVPVTPLWLTNLAAGLIAIPVRTYALATLLGILPASLIYAGIGSGLGALFASGAPLSLRSLITPKLVAPLVGLAVLAVLPVLYQRRRAARGPDA